MTAATTTATTTTSTAPAAQPKDDVALIFSKLSALPIATQHPHLLLLCRPIIQLWHDTFSVADPPLWNRMRRALPKELNESAFIIGEMIKFFENVEDGGVPYTIVDNCSGVGFLSMFLSHLLPPAKCSRIWAVDTLFEMNEKALAGVAAVEKDTEDAVDGNGDNNIAKTQEVGSAGTGNRIHIGSAHLTSAIHPIPIRPRKANIKKGRELKQISKHCIDRAPGPTIILGVHLCKSLSVHTVRLFNTCPKACRLYLKPCCLPGRKGLRCREPPFWTFEHMDGGGLGVVTLYCGEVKQQKEEKGGSVGEKEDPMDIDRELKKMGREAAKAEGRGGEESHHDGHSGGLKGGQLFKRWTDLLCDAVDTSQDGVTADVYHVNVQRRHFQNDYIVATRPVSLAEYKIV